MRPPKSVRFKMDQEYRLHRVLHLAKKYGWEQVRNFVFSKKGDILKLNFSESIIETSIFHPSRGYTTLIRKGELTHNIVESIFRNPRQHTGMGQYGR